MRPDTLMPDYVGPATFIRHAAAILALTMPILAFQHPTPVTVSVGGKFQMIALPSALQDFALHVEAVFSQNPNEGIGLIAGPSSQNFGDQAVTIRALGNVVQARGANGYPANGSAFNPGVPTQLIITGNVPLKKFSAWMALPGKSYVRIADNVAFRSGTHPASIDTLVVWAETGTISVSLVTGSGGAGMYNQMVLADHPVAFWNLNPRSGTEPDLSGNLNTGTYQGGSPAVTAMPNGDQAAVFNGSNEYLTIPSNPSFSIPSTGSLTWEMWIKPSVLQFPHSNGAYVTVMGKCANYSPTCEWQSRLYNTTNPQNRCNRLSAYAFNPTAELGSGAEWQPACGLLQAGQWLHVVGEYSTLSQPSGCPSDPDHPGSIDIWVNSVKWNQSVHNPTGCMSQFGVAPQANNSPLNIGTMARDTWFSGAIAKVAIYDHALTQAQIANHYQAMTGRMPTGSCGNTCAF